MFRATRRKLMKRVRPRAKADSQLIKYQYLHGSSRSHHRKAPAAARPPPSMHSPALG